MGWFLGYLKAPHFEDTKMFWIGFAACMFLVACILILDYLYNSKTAGASRKRKLRLGFLSMIVLLAASLPGIITSRIDSNLRNQLETEQDRRKMEEAKRVSAQMTSYMDGLGALLARIDKDMSISSARSLSDTTIDLVVAFNDQLKPYHIVTKDSITKEKYSPEKGQLLLQLAHRRIDSLSFAQIKSRTSFSSTYLPNANLDSTDLSGIDLSGSYMPECSFNFATLKYTTIYSADLQASSFTNTKLEKCNFNRCNLEMSQFNRCPIKHTTFVASNISFVDIYGCNMDSCSLILAKLKHGLVQNVKMQECNLEWVDLTNCTFISVNFFQGSLLKTKFLNTSFDGVNVYSVRVIPNFLEVIEPRFLFQAKHFKQEYVCKPDTTTGYFVLLRDTSQE